MIAYYQVGKGHSIYSTDVGSLPTGAVVSFGGSALPVWILFILNLVMACLALAFSKTALPGCMPILSNNSIALAAACRVSPLARIPNDDDRDGVDAHAARLEAIMAALDGGMDPSSSGTELQEFLPPAEDAGNESQPGNAKDMIYHRLMWGEVKMPEDWYQQYGFEDDGAPRVGHLSFGTYLDDPQPPTKGRLYA